MIKETQALKRNGSVVVRQRPGYVISARLPASTYRAAMETTRLLDVRVKPHRGSVLLIVLVVVALLALGAYTFSEYMLVEAKATSEFGREVQARALADSGLELAASLLAKRYEQNPQSFYSNPEWFEGVVVHNSSSLKSRGRFSVVSAAEGDPTGRSLRYGLSDESGKLNLNTLVAWQQAGTIPDDDTARLALMSIPDMTAEIADAILDWIDTDQVMRANGAEVDYYQGLNPPYPTKDNALDTLDELLLVKGITPQLLFGEDLNHNGVLDPNENDGAASPPLDNSDGMLQRGWSTYLTVFSREINQRSDGQNRININQTDLSALYDLVSAQFDSNFAQFVIAYRLNGPSGGGSSGGSGSSSSTGGSGSSGSNSGSSSSGSGNSSGGSKSGSSSGGSSGSSSSKSGSSSGGSKSSSGSSSTGGNAGSSSPGQASGGTPQIVAGMDVSKGASYTVKSLYEVFGATTTATINGAGSSLKSPWTNSTQDISTNVAKLLDVMTLTDAPYVDGRININLAPREILMGIPNMTEQLADSIFGAQSKGSSGQSLADQTPDRMTTAWVVSNSLTDINTLETIDPYICARGDVFHLQSVGYFDGGGPMARVEAVIDATQTPPQIVFMRDLTELGRGFSGNALTNGTGATR